MPEAARNHAIPLADAAAGPAVGAQLDAVALDARGAPPPRARGTLGVWSELTKLRLNALVVGTTAVGFALAAIGPIDWALLGWTCAGTALAAASASLFNQLFERRRDALMHRTRGRPLPAKQIGPATVFVAAVLTGYAGAALLGLMVGLLPAALAAINILLYAVLYTPLKPRTTFNTLVGAICGAIPPVIGWTAVTGALEPGAWLLGAVLFVWQIPHFLALAWMYREDYARGGHAMLPVRDGSGEITAQAVVITTVPLIPLGLSATLLGLAGVWSAGVSLVLGLWFLWLSIGFYRRRDHASARRLFLGSITYLPLVLAVMTLDRGSISAEAFLRGRGDGAAVTRSTAAPQPVEGEPVEGESVEGESVEGESADTIQGSTP
jgi:protoheme IX farnesyltransferase